MQKHVTLVDLVKSFPTNIFLLNLASIQKKTSPIKFAYVAEKSEKVSVSNLSTKARTPTTSPPDTPSGGDDNSPTQSPTPDIIVQSSFPGGGPSDPAKTSPAPATQSPTPEVIVQSSFPGGGPSDPTATSEPTEQPMVGIFGYAEDTKVGKKWVR